MVVIGAGPSGLAVAATVRRTGVPVVVVERGEQVGVSWAQRYDHLRLHTARGGSRLPGLALPRRFGSWVARDDFVQYLERYREHHRLEVRLATRARRIEAAAASGTGGPYWKVQTGDETIAARAVVVATGRCHTPHVPDWPGRDSFSGDFLHSADYRSPAPYRGRSVLVVGAGNSGTEIAGVLAQAGARKVWIALRTPPNILPRSSSRWHTVGRMTEFLPLSWRDRSALLMQRCAVGDLTSYGVARPTAGPFTRNAREGNNPVLDHGFVKSVRARMVQPVAAVTAFDGRRVVLADGSHLVPDAVIAATGYRPHLESLLPGPDLLDALGRPAAHGARTIPAAPHLYFAGFTNPLSGALHQAGVEARAIARAIAAPYPSMPGQRSGTSNSASGTLSSAP
ncbi:flavin-containing monooxygenase [Streptomyces sp. SDr-06]|uniref:flavin-containing monooxygenase n=1 Tax=Streptomyces sp. SDr-06 TaxID=2267702 RepID=UPI001CB9BA98|nr:NAD(P)/FAD-dependent oxidoreductase [Streptomyces sp. SDr-06]